MSGEPESSAGVVDNRGVRIAYRALGRGEPLVLVHGWSGEGRYWDEFGYVERLRAEYRLVIPDCAGTAKARFQRIAISAFPRTLPM